ncbi:hypothetical protein DICPUDRAFT_86492 [Dictyostelium purpureum]|uniref:Protein-tyrosine-phosphatase n=1 Tax=Dictyostelium purpureum TaxID=5786 RepID=F0ZBZ2_DICPU|nr:uncharacterized protein DICPUDRAFT_86492 [Dictyostelium purpureum]EGC38544.1 hypothetical protein DICPUDRAFT_86492 [Dictyostelium purpureum]|eukprot:XP_003284915.1 hypothetical protein DICPUDRAFT_86492 [Dictyostelium purpureum]
MNNNNNFNTNNNNVISNTPQQITFTNFLTIIIPIKILITLYLFYKARLPISFARYFGRVFHFFTSPLVMLFQWAGLRGPLISQIDDNVYLGAMPMSYNIEMLVSKYQINSVVNLCDEYNGPIQQYTRYGITQLYIPVVDHYEPTVQEIKSSIDFIQRQVESGNRVFIHCKAGRGRSGAIAICWLAHSKRISIEQAQKMLLEKRSKVRRGLYKQKNVLQFYNQYCFN